MDPTASINSLHDLLEAVETAQDKLKMEPWWRGQPQDWPLVPTVHRPSDKGALYESTILKDFRARARTRRTDCPPADADAAWLFLAQHYRLPTRLLDWTESPLVGLYFAIADEAPESWEKDGVLYALNAYELTGLTDGSGEPTILHTGHPIAESLVEEAYLHPDQESEDKRVVGLMVEEVDLRMMVQSSAVTIHGSRQPLEDHIAAKSILDKFTVSADAKMDLWWKLKSLGIRTRNLFPDLDHLALDLREDNYE